MTAVESFYIQSIQRPLSGWNVVREEVRDNASGAVTDVYDYYGGRDLSGSLQSAGGVGGLLAYTRNGALRIPVYDHIGNVVAVVDGASTTVAAYEYDPFGNIVSQSGSEADEVPFRFSTKYFDHETGLYYYGYRFYSTEMGRWMNRDPSGERSGMTLYGFVSIVSCGLRWTKIGTLIDQAAFLHNKASSLQVDADDYAKTTLDYLLNQVREKRELAQNFDKKFRDANANIQEKMSLLKKR